MPQAAPRWGRYMVLDSLDFVLNNLPGNMFSISGFEQQTLFLQGVLSRARASRALVRRARHALPLPNTGRCHCAASSLEDKRKWMGALLPSAQPHHCPVHGLALRRASARDRDTWLAKEATVPMQLLSLLCYRCRR